MLVVKTVRELDALPQRGSVLVPTMGALHAGHAALVSAAVQLRDQHHPGLPVVVSVFVNPTQFNDKSDLSRYPRTLEADVAICRERGAEVVFAPDEAEVYPPGRTVAAPPLPPVAREPGLEDAARPGHFAGVCQVVARLFDLTRPVVALFGEKDWQQLKVIQAMVAAREGLSARPRIVGVPTVREPGGLAMSSRNVFLTAEERVRALAISKALCDAAGCPTVATADGAMRAGLEAAGLKIEYAVVRHEQTLLSASSTEQRRGDGWRGRALIAARLGTVRLIDNAAWG